LLTQKPFDLHFVETQNAAQWRQHSLLTSTPAPALDVGAWIWDFFTSFRRHDSYYSQLTARSPEPEIELLCH
jgi:hypothetical protein